LSGGSLVLQLSMKCLRCNRDTHNFESALWAAKYFCPACTEVILMEWLMAQLAMLKVKVTRIDSSGSEHG